MKKLFTFMAAGLFTSAVFSQACTPIQLAEPKFEPDPQTIDCFRKGNAVDQTFYFKIPASVSTFTIQYMAIDSVTNLPAGLTAELNKAWGAQYAGNENGCVKVTGTSNAAAGQYRLGIYVRLKAQNLPELKDDLYNVAASQMSPQEAQNYIIWLRLADVSAPCPCVDTTKVTVNDFTAYTGNEANCANGISDLNSTVSGLTIVPNPFSSSATVNFVSETEGTFTARITDLIGKEVMRSSENISLGSNSINISRNSLPAGVYFFSLTNGKSNVTKRFVIE